MSIGLSDVSETPIPENLCGFWVIINSKTHTGSCVFTKHHEGKHSWEK